MSTARVITDGIYVPVPTVSVLATGAAVAIALLQLAGGEAGEAAAAAGILGGAAIGWLADYRYFPAAMLLCFPALGISPVDFPAAVQFAPVAGTEVAAPLALMVVAGSRSILEAMRSAKCRIGWPSRAPVALFVVALLVAAAGGLQARAMGLNAWSLGVRSVLAVGGLFWGYMLVRNADSAGRERIPPMLVASTIAGALLYATTILRGHLIFILIGLCAALLGHFARDRRPVAFLLCAVVAGAGLLLYTLTTAAIVLIAGGCLLLTRLPAGVLRRWIVRAAILMIALLSAGSIWAVMQFGERLGLEMAVQATRSDGLVQYALFKLMVDRGSLWLAAAQQIAAGPYFIVPSGRALYPLIGVHGGLEWYSGPHNSVLQVVRNTGLIAGGGVLILMLIAVTAAGRILARTDRPLTRAFAAAFIAVAVSGVTTGDFPVTDVGFFVWLLGGLTIGLDRAERIETETKAVGDPVRAGT
jgi:hypothetical protein